MNIIFIDTETSKNRNLYQLGYIYCQQFPSIIIHDSFYFNETDKIKTFESYFEKADSMCAHNASFDINILKRSDLNIKQKLQTIEIKCTCSMYGRISLNNLYLREFGKNIENWHNAHYDVLALYEIVKKLANF